MTATARIVNLFFPAHMYRKLLHMHSSTIQRDQVVFDILWQYSTQGVWAGITSQGGIQGQGHCCYPV